MRERGEGEAVDAAGQRDRDLAAGLEHGLEARDRVREIQGFAQWAFGHGA